MARGDALPKWLVRRGKRIHYWRRVPKRYAHVDERVFVDVSCETDDVAAAIVLRDRINAETEAYWQALVRGSEPDAKARYRAAIDFARAAGFAYQPLSAITHEDLDTVLERINALQQWRASHHGAKRPLPAHDQPARALLGGEAEPGLVLSTLLETYEELTREERRDKSPGQMHKWRLPRLRAIRNLIGVVGDKPVADLTRADAIAFRAWWSDRIVEDDLAMETPNKDIAYVATMIGTVSDRLDLDLGRRFQGLRFKSASESPPPFSTGFIRERLLADGALAGLNDDARGLVLVMIETGCRPIEIIHLRPEDIRLDHDIPHISVEPYKGYSLKTKYSRRQTPLVGVALEGAKILTTAAGRYRDKSGSLSAAVNKFFATNDLRESERHTLYSLRHAFKDRLTDASAPDIVDAALMGHKFSRPAYGKGPKLELKLEWLTKIAVSL
ncbi:integrase [Jiella sp. MQZ9-1]|uniref:Integrase n=1 Tax=Jiella flava TaxID=2816857 RepID=A0A939FWL1_9HYPH|nr:integrase [Jiella flava]MBO0662820.1 integrase [Jiella flava]MCD2471419.1 integrase [Jiella flava]